jgi:hypothetical protein
MQSNIINIIAEKNPNALLADGLNEAIVGMTDSSEPVPIYDKQKCVEVMMKKEGWDYTTALEFLEFNTFSAYMGEHTPMFVDMPPFDC